ncbi:TraB/GumN family protein [Hufsiella ginkgonis]|uniref:TraB/GumN family protein n=1 Tax=Hufsiella ginkgonis TaxID=2695274 RepID=A0A7K1XV54_9SPHI|nr:TraB/GumN family protein [Hufsiella ginkgonis]MXV14649.1 hypothetical protein [Hufsiella ginkgonis]
MLPKNLKLLLFFFLLPGIGSYAQTSAKRNNTLLWQVSGNGLKQPSYIFGSYHLAGKNFIDTLPKVLEAFNKTSGVMGEIVLTDAASLMQKVFPFIAMEKGTIADVLTAEEYTEVDQALQKLPGAAKLDMLKTLKPAAIQVTIAGMVAPNNVTESNPALDQYFQDEAKRTGKMIRGLETVEEQSAILFNTPIARQKEQLLKTVREIDKCRKESAQLFNAYKAANLEALEKSLSGYEDYTTAELNDILYDRNKKWAGKVPGVMEAGPTFFVVGAGHLPGEKGLLSLLKKAGYTVKPMSTR